MSYFADHYSAVSLPIESDQQPGLRNAQLGAVHDIPSYFTLQPEPGRADPAPVVMPIGSGKTAELVLGGFPLRALQIPIVSPSPAVRDQIADEGAGLPVFNKLISPREISRLRGSVKPLVLSGRRILGEA